MANPPLKKFKYGGIEASVFENQIQKNGKTISVKKVVFQKRYRSADGEWKGTSSLDVQEVPKAIVALWKAYEYVLGSGSEGPGGEEPPE